MGKIDFTGALRKTTDAIEKGKESLSNNEKLKDTLKNLKETGEETIKKSQDTIQKGKENIQNNANLKNAANAFAEAGNGAIRALKKMSEETAENIKEVLAKREGYQEGCLTTEATMNLFYLLMASDQHFHEKELEKFDLIGKDLDPEFDSHRDAWLKKFSLQLAPTIDNKDVILAGIQSACEQGFNVPGAYVPKRIIIWNLLAIAGADGSVSEVEHQTIIKICDAVQLDQSVLQEMEAMIATIHAVDHEIDIAKNSGHSYEEVQTLITKLEARKAVISKSIEMLMID